MEVEIPPHIPEETLIAVGKLYCETDDTDGMGVEEALQWAFAHSGGVATLAGMGVRWHTIHTGTTEAI